MFDKIKEKLNSSSDSENATTQQPNGSTPSINEPSSSGPSTRHQSDGSIDDQERGGRMSVSDDRGRSSSGNVQARTASKSRSRSRARDVLWKSSLYDSGAPQQTHKQDPNLKAKSLSVAAPHPTMAEEDMKKMPYTDWSTKN